VVRWSFRRGGAVYKLNPADPYIERRLVSTLHSYEVKTWFQSLLSNGSTCTATPWHRDEFAPYQAGGLYKLRMQLTHSLKGAWFWFQPLNLETYQVTRNWFQSFLSNGSTCTATSRCSWTRGTLPSWGLYKSTHLKANGCTQLTHTSA
jgi:hypothetical protein